MRGLLARSAPPSAYRTFEAARASFVGAQFRSDARTPRRPPRPHPGRARCARLDPPTRPQWMRGCAPRPLMWGLRPHAPHGRRLRRGPRGRTRSPRAAPAPSPPARPFQNRHSGSPFPSFRLALPAIPARPSRHSSSPSRSFRLALPVIPARPSRHSGSPSRSFRLALPVIPARPSRHSGSPFPSFRLALPVIPAKAGIQGAVGSLDASIRVLTLLYSGSYARGSRGSG